MKTKEAWDAFQFQLAQRGFIPEDIDQVVLTHHHPDHIGLLEWLSDDIPVYGHPYARPWLERDESFLRDMIDFMHGSLPNLVFKAMLQAC
ncbi:MBL fold metallo-hydrolase [Bacillus sp. N9]